MEMTNRRDVVKRGAAIIAAAVSVPAFLTTPAAEALNFEPTLSENSFLLRRLTSHLWAIEFSDPDLSGTVEQVFVPGFFPLEEGSFALPSHYEMRITILDRATMIQDTLGIEVEFANSMSADILANVQQTVLFINHYLLSRENDFGGVAHREVWRTTEYGGGTSWLGRMAHGDYPAEIFEPILG